MRPDLGLMSIGPSGKLFSQLALCRDPSMLRLNPALLAFPVALGRLQFVPAFQQCHVAGPWRVNPWLVTRRATQNCLVSLREKRVCICW